MDATLAVVVDPFAKTALVEVAVALSVGIAGAVVDAVA
jgi:hypothetical protein